MARQFNGELSRFGQRNPQTPSEARLVFHHVRELPVGGPVAVSGDGRTLATRSIPKAGQPNRVWEWNIS